MITILVSYDRVIFNAVAQDVVSQMNEINIIFILWGASK